MVLRWKSAGDQLRAGGACIVLEYKVEAHRVNAHGALATSKAAEIELDTDPAGRADAFNPAELLLASLAACILKSMERVAPMLHFELDSASIEIRGVRQHNPPRMISIDYVLIVETQETDQRLDLLHKNVRKYGTISNTVAAATELNGTIRRQA
jgi:uncharacterized OsmC-like protein